MRDPEKNSAALVRSHLQTTFRSLRHRNYRLFFGGQGLSLIGTWMQQIAISWLVYRLSGSAVALGTVAFAGQIPGFVLAPLGGIVADRYRRHAVLLITQIASMLQAAVLAFLVVSGRVEIWHLIVLNTILGTINAFDMPTRHAFVVEMIDDPDDLANAIALNSSMFNGARLIGPTLAGVIIAAWGEGPCFVINAISYVAVIISLLLMQLRRVSPAAHDVHPLAQLKAGFLYAWRFGPIRYLILFIGVVSLVGMPYAVLLPIFADEFLHGGSKTYGVLVGASGVGAVAGALYMASRRTVLGLGKILVFAGLLFATALALFALSTSLWLSLLLLLFAGFGAMVQMACCNTLLQTLVDDDKRGMVMSIYIMAFIGMAPIGNLLAGVLAHQIGAHVTVLIGAVLCLLTCGLFARKLPQIRKIVHPIYIKKGILPQPPL